jgi:hypothetical protein
VQPAVNIGGRQLILCCVVAELEQPGATWSNLWIIWCNPQSTLAGVSLFSAVLWPSWSNLEQPLNNLVQPAVNIGERQLIFRCVAAKLEQPGATQRNLWIIWCNLQLTLAGISLFSAVLWPSWSNLEQLGATSE